MSDYVFEKGFIRNPLRRFPNLPCPCQSGKKAKRCCGMIPCLDEKTAEQVATYLRHLENMGFIERRTPKARTK